MKTVHRSARTGRFVKADTARRNPRTTVTERVGAAAGKGASVGRSAITGRFVAAATVARHPGTTVTQRVSR